MVRLSSAKELGADTKHLVFPDETEAETSVLYRPVSIFAMACGCTLLVSGALADVVGSRPIFLLGCLLQSLFSLACGLSHTGTQLIVYRAFSGAATSLCVPAAVSIIYDTYPAGQRRNLAFAMMGGGQPVGWAIGLTVGGVVADTIGWPWGFHIVVVCNSVVLVLAAWQLPSNAKQSPPISWRRLVFDIDWVGAVLASISLALLSYVLA